MTGSVGDNVTPLHRPRGPHSIRGLSREMVSAARSFDALERRAAMLNSTPLGVAGETDAAEWPIVSFQIQLSVVQRCLDQLRNINIANWANMRWVLRLEDSHADAMLCLDAVTNTLCSNPPGTGSLDSRLTADIRNLMDVLHELRELIAQQCPEVIYLS
jgi:hypothetical protein